MAEAWLQNGQLFNSVKRTPDADTIQCPDCAPVDTPQSTMLLTYDLEGVESHWRVKAGIDATNGPGGVVRPANYANGTNEVVLHRIS